MSTIRREFRIEHLKGFHTGNLLDAKVAVLIGEAKYVTPTFSELEIELISESASQSELESGNKHNESELVMIFKYFLESDRRLKGNILQVAVTESIEFFKSVTPPYLEDVVK